MLQTAADHWNYREDDTGYFAQPDKLFRLVSPAQQEILFGNTARVLSDAPKEIKSRHISNCLTADPAYNKGMAKDLKIPMKAVK